MKTLEHWDWKHSTDINFKRRKRRNYMRFITGLIIGLILGALAIYAILALIVIHYLK